MIIFDIRTYFQSHIAISKRYDIGKDFFFKYNCQVLNFRDEKICVGNGSFFISMMTVN